MSNLVAIVSSVVSLTETSLRQLLKEVEKRKELAPIKAAKSTYTLIEDMPMGEAIDAGQEMWDRGVIRVLSPHSGTVFEITLKPELYTQESLGFSCPLNKKNRF